MASPLSSIHLVPPPISPTTGGPACWGGHWIPIFHHGLGASPHLRFLSWPLSNSNLGPAGGSHWTPGFNMTQWPLHPVSRWPPSDIQFFWGPAPRGGHWVSKCMYHDHLLYVFFEAFGFVKHQQVCCIFTHSISSSCICRMRTMLLLVY